MKNGQGAPIPLTDVDSTGDLDVWMPGAYLGDSSSNPLPTNVQPRQNRRALARFQDVLPEPPVPAPALRSQLPTVYLMVTNPLKTAMNSFGLFRQYLFHPSYDPDALVNPGDLSNIVTSAPPPPPAPKPRDTNHEPPWPFANMSVWRLMRWLNTGSKSKSEGEVDRLVGDVLNAPDFRAEDLRNFSATRENDHLVEQAVVYSTLPQEYSTLTFRGEVVAEGGGVDERSEVMYWHRGAYIIYYRDITGHSCIA